MFCILLPQIAIFLPYFIDELTICCTRCTLDANVATTILFELFKNNLSKTSPTELSDIELIVEVSSISEDSSDNSVELSLDGSLRPVAGILPIVSGIKDFGVSKVIVPYDNAKEAALVPDVEVFAAKNLAQVVNHFMSEKNLGSEH